MSRRKKAKSMAQKTMHKEKMQALHADREAQRDLRRKFLSLKRVYRKKK